MHCRDRKIFIEQLVIFRRFWKMTRFLKSIIKQKVFISDLWNLKLEILSDWKLIYSKIISFQWKHFELLAFEHVRLKKGHTICIMYAYKPLHRHSKLRLLTRKLSGCRRNINSLIIYIIIWFRLSVCMYVCLYVRLYVRMLSPHNSKTTGRIFKI